MAIEIERKFLVINDNWRISASEGVKFIQGYFTTNKNCSIRVRIEGINAAINIKSATLGITRSEFNYPVPIDDAREMLKFLCEKPLIEKTRYIINHDNRKWEIDIFSGDNEGLTVAEIELDSVNESFKKPDWAGKEVSDDARYYNVSLVKEPFKDW